MKRVSSILFALAVAGCGGNGGNGGTVDLSMTPKPDLLPGPDLLQPTGPCLNGMPGCTGDPCTKPTDCAAGKGTNQNPNCVKTVTPMGGTPITFDGGFCQTPCRPSKNDVNNNYLNPDCPGGNATCAGSNTSGFCVPVCQSVTDCRDKYVCAFTNGTPNGDCEPIGASTCDPPKDPRPGMVNCPQGQVCVSYSPDNSYGQCAEKCDPILQNCPPPAQGTDGCIVDFNATDGSGECINVNQGVEGDPCTFLNDCDAGMMCYGQKCRHFCRTGGVQTDMGTGDAGLIGLCPTGQTCKDIKLSGITIQFTAAQTGICSP